MIEKKIFRHPEKRNNPDRPMQEKPSWIKVKVSLKKNYHDTLDIIKKHNLVTVCEEAGCPNIGECWNKRHATFMIMGDICTRGCAFCNVKTGRPKALDPLEPLRIADAVSKLQLLHTVITSVDRDDLIDGGAHHFAQVVGQIRKIAPHTTIEILTPDFQGKEESVDTILKEPPDVFNHNLETVPRLYPKIRPGARYFTSLELLYRAKCKNPLIFTKTGLMVGLGETQEEVLQVMDDCRAADIDFLTIGQYLQPTPKHAPVSRFVTPDEFNLYAKFARAKGFLMVSASPLTRSSYMAGEDFHKLRIAREKKFLYT